MFKVSVYVVGHFAIGEGVIKFCYDLLHIVQLVLIYHADQHGFLLAGISTDRFDPGSTVAQLLMDLLGDLIGMVGNDRKFIGAFLCLSKM